MALSTETFVGVLGQQTYAFTTLRFLSSAHLGATINGAGATFTVNAARTTITLVEPVANGDAIVVTRTTPYTDEGRLVDFNDLSHVRQADLDTSSLQLLYIAQETLDAVFGGTLMGLNVGGHWDGENRRIENLAAGVAGSDAVTKSQLDAVSVAAGNLPVVTSADNNKSLWVVTGAWAIRTPTQARAHLGLGTAATLNAGTGANQVVQLDGSARYPSNDGRNIDLANNAVTAALNLRYRSTIGNVLQSTLATPVNDATATWAQSAASRLTPGTLTDLDNSSDIVVDNTGKKVTLSAGTWEIEYVVRAYNVNTTAGNDQDIRLKVTNDDDTGAQVVYDSDHDRVTVESPGTTPRALMSLHNILLVKFPSGGTIVLRATNEDGVDLRIDSTRMVFRKVSTSTT